MKYLKIILDPIKVKGNIDDPEQLQQDLYEKVQAMIEAETLSFTVDEEDEDDEDC
jgi:hypothetical protein